jgi:hypothetical protein
MVLESTWGNHLLGIENADLSLFELMVSKQTSAFFYLKEIATSQDNFIPNHFS